MPRKLASSYVANKETDRLISSSQQRLPAHSLEKAAMRDASEIHSCRILSFAVFLASLCLPPAIAQKNQEPSSPKYDLHTETKMKGIVDEVRLPPKGSEKEVAHLLVKSGTDSSTYTYAPSLFSTTWA